VQIAKGLPLALLGTIDYDATMGVGVLGDSKITEPRQLAGKKIAQVPASAEVPFFPLYAQRTGLDLKSVELIGTDPKLLERLMINKQVDALTGLASSTLPIILSQNLPCRWMLYSSVGLPNYGFTIMTQPALLAKDPALCGAFCDAMMESLAYVLKQPDEALEIFFKVLPEMGLNPTGRSLIRTGMNAQQFSVTKPPAREHGLLWGDPAVYDQMLDLVMETIMPPGSKRPAVDSFYTNRFSAHVKLTAAEWDAIAMRGVNFGKLLA
jgi:ABC-type nitrate/sulfonate/bicarbonate transport system substrate-binding protein